MTEKPEIPLDVQRSIVSPKAEVAEDAEAKQKVKPKKTATKKAATKK
jgi:hypothetical protein